MGYLFFPLFLATQVPTLNQQIIPTSAEKEIQKILRESEPILRMADINSGAANINDLAYKHFGPL